MILLSMKCLSMKCLTMKCPNADKSTNSQFKNIFWRFSEEPQKIFFIDERSDKSWFRSLARFNLSRGSMLRCFLAGVNQGVVFAPFLNHSSSFLHSFMQNTRGG